jgi:glucan 1,3-beta-glucosidase
VLTLQTEQDFADIAKVGLNWVRIPLGFWAIETQAGEPYLEGVSWQCVELELLDPDA